MVFGRFLLGLSLHCCPHPSLVCVCGCTVQWLCPCPSPFRFVFVLCIPSIPGLWAVNPANTIAHHSTQQGLKSSRGGLPLPLLLSDFLPFPLLLTHSFLASLPPLSVFYPPHLTLNAYLFSSSVFSLELSFVIPPPLLLPSNFFHRPSFLPRLKFLSS